MYKMYTINIALSFLIKIFLYLDCVDYEFIWMVTGKENIKMKHLVVGLWVFFTLKISYHAIQ